jgi:hypothetical protein
MWEEHETYWLSKIPQGTDDWKNLRKGRLTMSNAYKSRSKYTNKQTLANYICNIEQEQFTEEAWSRMNHGTKMEPYVRKWYEKTKGVEVNEYGLAIPKWNVYLGASVDGVVVENGMENGIIEIKCPKKMYKDLIEFGKVSEYHYDQMMGNMKVLNKEWCDYVVYASEDKKVHIKRIYFNEDYWNKMYNDMNFFIDTYIKPLKYNIVIPS